MNQDHKWTKRFSHLAEKHHVMACPEIIVTRLQPEIRHQPFKYHVLQQEDKHANKQANS